MSDIDPLDPEEQPITPLDTFTRAAAGEEFSGHLLQPWSASRKIAAQGMGLLYPFIGDDGEEALKHTGFYPGVQKDVIIFMWLRTREKASDVDRATRKPHAAWERAMAWAEINDLVDMGSEAFVAAYVIFCEKFSAVAQMSGAPDVQPDKSEGTGSPKV